MTFFTHSSGEDILASTTGLDMEIETEQFSQNVLLTGFLNMQLEQILKYVSAKRRNPPPVKKVGNEKYLY